MAAVPPKAEAQDSKGKERLLTISDLLDWLVADKMVEAADAEKMKKERRYYRGSQHPLAVIADQKWKSALAPHKPLTLEPLTEWLAKRVDMEYRHIDPLKIDFSSVTEVMSSTYATRFKILPIGVTTKEAVIAVSEPFVREWEKELQRIIKLEIRRVIANPQDIERYQVEFYNLAKSMKGAANSASCASASTACCTRSTRSPRRCWRR
jgi:general secretion pathway protein E